MTFGLSFLPTIFNQRQTKPIRRADVDINCFSKEKCRDQLSAEREDFPVRVTRLLIRIQPTVLQRIVVMSSLTK